LIPSAHHAQPISVGVRSTVHFLLGCRLPQKRSPRQQPIFPTRYSTNLTFWIPSSSRTHTISRICYSLMCPRIQKSLGNCRNRSSEGAGQNSPVSIVSRPGPPSHPATIVPMNRLEELRRRHEAAERIDRQDAYGGNVAPLTAECYSESRFSIRKTAGREPCVEPAALRRHFVARKQSRPQAHASQPRPPPRNVPRGWDQ